MKTKENDTMKKMIVHLSVAVLFMIAGLVSCGLPSGSEGPELGDRALFDKAQEYIKDEDYKAAILILTTFENNFPNSIYYKQVRLMKADALFSQDIRSGFIEAEAEYKAYMTLYPTSDDLDYVQKQIALCRWNRRRSEKKDSSEVHRAIEEFNIFLRKYPNSKYSSEVKKSLEEAKNHVADNEEYIADFYLNIDKFKAAENRYTAALEYRAGQEKRYEIYLKLFQALAGQKKLDESLALYEKLTKEKTDSGLNSPLLAEIDQILEKLKKDVALQQLLDKNKKPEENDKKPAESEKKPDAQQ